MSKLGVRIKYFRKRAGLSQLELESSIDASPGMVSRIENGQVNPTKESVRKIADVLKLNNLEVDYLIGSLVEPATPDEIQLAKDLVKDYYERKNTYGYLSDDRWRVYYFSKGFRILLKNILPRTFNTQKLENIPLIRLIIDEKLCIRSLFDPETYTKFMQSQLTKFYHDTGFMVDDPFYQEVVRWIMSDPLTKNIWKNIHELSSIPNIESRTITFKVKSLKVPMSYYKESLYEVPRFMMVEYKIDSRLVSKILGLL